MTTKEIKDVCEYVRNNVENFELRYSLAWDAIGKYRCSLESADPMLYDAISYAVEDYCNDNELDMDDFDIEENFG